MTHVVEHSSFRYSWELVRHTYVLDLESEIDIQQVEISPSHDGHLLPRPFPRTSFFEVEIDQIQKNGKTVFSFRNICPVEISRKPDWNPFHLVRKSGNMRITQRFQSQEGESETRWLYTDDFFLISLSSGDRHDLDMLLSLTIGKLNTIALSIQSGKRIRSEFENQQQYRADMSTMFSKGVDGAFRDVPVYQQHGEMTERDIDVSAALMSAEFQDLNASVAAGWSMPAESPAAAGVPLEPVSAGNIPSPERAPDSMHAGQATGGCIAAGEILPAECATGCVAAPDAVAGHSVADPHLTTSAGMESIPVHNYRSDNESTLMSDGPAGMQAPGTAAEDTVPAGSPGTEKVPRRVAPENGMPAEKTCGSCGAEISGTKKFCGSCGAAVGVSADQAEHLPAKKTCSSCGAGISDTTKFCGSCGAAVGPAISEERILAGKTCGSCGAGISDTTKFCGSCGAAVGSPDPAAERPQAPVEIPAQGDDGMEPPSARMAAGPAAVNLKSIEELKDLSWLSD